MIKTRLKSLRLTMKLFFMLAGMSLKQMLIYRKSFYISLVAMILWMTIYTVLIEVMYLHTDSIAGWSRGGMLTILAFYYFITSVANILYRENFENFGEKMRRGQLDQLLSKPASFQLQCFFSNIRFDQITSPLIAIALLFYAMADRETAPSFLSATLGIGYSLFSIVFFYHFLLLVASSAFWLEKVDTLGSVMWNLSQVGRYPRQIFTGAGKVFFEFIFPMALITSVPAEQFIRMNTGNLQLFFFAIIMVFSVVAQYLFAKGIKRYSSAN